MQARAARFAGIQRDHTPTTEDRIAMRLDEPAQVDMVLGDGARDRGAACELISPTRPPARESRTSGWNPTLTRCG